MLFKKIIFNNYKTFYGIQEMNFYIPKEEREAELKKNIILIGGLNGAGKTTIIKAIQEVLYGNRNYTPEEYKKQFSNVLNNTYYSEGGNNCSVTLILETDSGEEWQIQVKWYFNKDKVMSHFERELHIKAAGSTHMKKRKIDNPDAYNRLIDLIMPFHASPFFIFDGEEVKDIILRQSSKEMRDSIHKITGMQSYERLIADLKVAYAEVERESLRSFRNKEVGHLNDEMEELEKLVQENQEKVDTSRKKLLVLSNKKKELIDERNKAFINNSKSREEIVKKQTTIQNSISAKEELLKKEYNDSIAQIILSKKIEELQKVLKKEKSIRDQKVARELSLSPYREFMNALLQQEISPSLTEDQIKQINVIGERVWLGNSNSDIEHQELHDLSKSDYNTLMNIKTDGLSSIKRIQIQLSELKNENERINIELRSAPEMVDTSEIDEKISSYSKQEGVVSANSRVHNRRQSELDEKKRSLRNQLSRLSPEAVGDYEALELEKTRIRSVINALEEFIQQDTKLKAKMIQNEFVNMLNKLFRKQGEFSEITFDIETYTIRLFNDRGQEVNIQDRSAGEMQMISSALIWALIKVSDLDLPVVIDTPLGRLDSYHRTQLIEQYYNELSQQVIILSTDTEVSTNYVETMNEYTYRQYMLDYDQDKKYTIIRDGYFDLVKGGSI
ncbi:DNA sulfur modification protein DndD [Sporosarcina ureae]|uniref:Nuclease SbcCD subunit C n=1 Tax=Sporosarcina ureae TaxID=1571 RepID=A0ABM6JUT6_SPOUR|nr:DNA sulfur modification protein DndD [Sporosarcina ureae]ARF14016.1 hypothetical protein SporoS204_07565 [Sporosarcina ureae]